MLIDFFVPGFLIDTAISRTIARHQRSKEEFILTLLSWSSLNYALMSGFTFFLSRHQAAGPWQWWYYSLWQTISLLGGPLVISGVVSWLWSKSYLEKLKQKLGFKVHDPVPTAWDKFFGRGQFKLILVTLNDGSTVGGLFGEDSFASSFPADQDIYLEQTWVTDPQTGAFIEQVENSGGIWIKGSDIKYLEFYVIQHKEVTEDGKQETA